MWFWSYLYFTKEVCLTNININNNNNNNNNKTITGIITLFVGYVQVYNSVVGGAEEEGGRD